MIYVAIKAALSGLLAALVSEIAKRSPAFGALVASLPDLRHGGHLAVARHWRQRADSLVRGNHVLLRHPVAADVPAGPAMLRGGVTFWPALVAGCFVTIVLYLLTAWVAARFGIQL
jgi:hypothetical protein